MLKPLERDILSRVHKLAVKNNLNLNNLDVFIQVITKANEMFEQTENFIEINLEHCGCEKSQSIDEIQTMENTYGQEFKVPTLLKPTPF